jgi:1-aminocyclopropane-1-carboxylate deaminase
VIRGEEHRPLNDTLGFATAHGMRLTYLDRNTYRAKDTGSVLAALRAGFGPCYVLPEGGSNALAVRGCAEVAAEIAEPFDIICCPVGTGGTLAGLAAGLRPEQRALGFSVLRGGRFLDRDVARLQREALGAPTANWSVNYDFHCGGYARRPPELTRFCADFERRHELPLDWVYVAKMLLGIVTLTGQGAFRPGTILVAVITGPAAHPGPAD